MVSLEQVKLLETKVAKAIEYVEQVTRENAALFQHEAELLQKEAELRGKLDSYQKRIDELEVLVMRFKEDQGRIEDGILSALDRLNQFEDAIEKSLGGKEGKTPPEAKETPKAQKAKQSSTPAQQATAAKQAMAAAAPAAGSGGDAEGAIFFEIPEAEPAEDDIESLPEESPLGENDTAENGELDIF